MQKIAIVSLRRSFFALQNKFKPKSREEIVGREKSYILKNHSEKED